MGEAADAVEFLTNEHHKEREEWALTRKATQALELPMARRNTLSLNDSVATSDSLSDGNESEKLDQVPALNNATEGHASSCIGWSVTSMPSHARKRRASRMAKQLAK